jgi:hypothetical protein
MFAASDLDRQQDSASSKEQECGRGEHEFNDLSLKNASGGSHGTVPQALGDRRARDLIFAILKYNL